MFSEEYKSLIIRVLTGLFPDATIYLFGSRARGTEQPASDIDLAIDANKPLPFQEILQAKDVMEALRMPYTVDVVDIHSTPQKLKDSILKEGIIWKQGTKK